MSFCRLTIFLLGVFSLGLSTSVAALKGPHRMIAPEAFGMERIANEIFAPAPATPRLARMAIDAVETGRSKASRFYGYTIRQPRVVICPKDACDSIIGPNGARGVAYGGHLVRLNQLGINPTIATHEFMHTALRDRVGNVRMFLGAIPAWFDEGLAVLQSGDMRFPESIATEVLTDLQTRHNWWQWSDLVSEHDWPATYGGAKLLVTNIRERVGDDGIREIIDRVANGEAFNSALSAVTDRKLPALSP